MALVLWIGVGKINAQIQSLESAPTSDRHEMVDGQRVPYWITSHRGESMRIYLCPGQEPRIAIARQGITCTQEKTND